MSDRALFAAFQKVKAQVDDAVSLTREREARARAEEEKARAAKKTRVVKAAETRRAEAGTASISASAFSATGGLRRGARRRGEVVGCILPHGGPRKVAGRTARDGAEGGAVGSAKACADVPFHEGEGGAGKTTRCQSGSSRPQALR